MWIKKGMLPQQGLKNVYKKRNAAAAGTLRNDAILKSLELRFTSFLIMI
jgi:hypothetical protein